MAIAYHASRDGEREVLMCLDDLAVAYPFDQLLLVQPSHSLVGPYAEYVVKEERQPGGERHHSVGQWISGSDIGSNAIAMSAEPTHNDWNIHLSVCKRSRTGSYSNDSMESLCSIRSLLNREWSTATTILRIPASPTARNEDTGDDFTYDKNP